MINLGDLGLMSENAHSPIRKPAWLKTKIPTGSTYFEIKKDLRSRSLATVCEEAKCPNIGECWNTRTATFMVGGDTCTRACRFCNVKTGNPDGWLDEKEPQQVAESARLMGLKYIVITMVDRDDLPDGGAQHIAKVIQQVRQQNPEIIVEILASDFAGNTSVMDQIIAAGVDVYGHNMETVSRLTPRVRDGRAHYQQSLEVLGYVRRVGPKTMLTKSAIMLGLGETPDEVVQVLTDLRQQAVDLICIGQYMRPTKKHLSVKQWIPPEQFQQWHEKALELGFKGVICGPLVRSSYKAYDFYQSILQSASQSDTR